MIWSSVTRKVVSQPWTTVPSESPTSRQSTPASSSSRAVVKSYAVSTLIRRPCAFQRAKSGIVTGAAASPRERAMGTGHSVVGTVERGEEHPGPVHHHVVSAANRFVQGQTRGVGRRGGYVGEVPGPAPAVELHQIDRPCNAVSF